METLFDALKYLARRYHGRWSRLDDALLRIRAEDDGGRSKEGERARRTLINAFRVQAYLGPTRDTLYADRSNAIRKLGEPLSEALGHIITIELADQMLEALEEAERARGQERDDAEAVEGSSSSYGPLITALHRHGVNRGNYHVLLDVEYAAIARYIRRKVEQRLAPLPPIRSASEMRSPHGRLHPFWNPYRMSFKRGAP
ncbi:hypothetical protein K9B35_14940 [Sphingomonas sp. R647]|uniref:hypothetical protein n=1 Tax=unclassified Sphingomonas TaxID=196159 RepID=UPI001CD20DC9|nr:hypothetical protein [Sphingomonas sp. R647]MCA1199266.1 hypothetical protein [Sphingomonas sp. R647]